MDIIIYGKDGCPNCDKARMLCQIQSLPFNYQTVGTDISVEALQAKAGQHVRSLPQIFLQTAESIVHIGGYEELRNHLRSRQ